VSPERTPRNEYTGDRVSHAQAPVRKADCGSFSSTLPVDPSASLARYTKSAAVEAYPFDVEAVKTSSSFLHAGTVRMFLAEGFEQLRQIGKSQWVVRKTLESYGPQRRENHDLGQT
jgi:hypothetical protein